MRFLALSGLALPHFCTLCVQNGASRGCAFLSFWGKGNGQGKSMKMGALAALAPFGFLGASILPLAPAPSSEQGKGQGALQPPNLRKTPPARSKAGHATQGPGRQG